MKYFVLFFLSFLPAVSLLAQPPIDPSRKQMEALRVNESIRIDGVLDEPIWMQAQPATDFKQYQPDPGKPASQRTEVRILYDNNALYIGAVLYDIKPDSILMEMSDRDRLGNTDFFAFILDTYRDGINGLGFVVTPAGIQFDTKFSALGRSGGGPGSIFSGDTNWDAVWDSEVKIGPEGWVVEMKIPYAAIRFPERDHQLWNLNFLRGIRRSREEVYWNPVDPNGARMISQAGQISGIQDVKAPLRLSATPFVTSYFSHYKFLQEGETGEWGRNLSGGMDVKYGINDAFTLDMTLIPDFGEAISDNQVLNLSPFEIRFDENRQFFTEGVELFNKGNFFYSRRVGGTPMDYWDVQDEEVLEEGEVIDRNPQQTQLVNATKVSGRTDGGLGVGVFNAVSARTMATLRNSETGAVREYETNPLTNYNVFVLDQNLPNNSFATLVNTNVMRSGGTYDANVTGTVFDLRNKDNSYSINGKAGLSQKYFTDTVELGHTYNINFQKTSGQWQYGVYYNVESDDYDPNDLGFLFNNNERSIGFDLDFNRYEPFGNFNFGGASFFIGYDRLYHPNVFTDFGFNFSGRLVTRNFFAFGSWMRFEPVKTYDYFEPRVDGRYYTWPTSANVGGWISTDYRKTYAIDVNINYRPFNEPGRYNLNIDIENRLRISDRLSFRFDVGSYNFFNDVGWVETVSDDEIIFGRRDRLTVVTGLTTVYNFTNRMNLNVRARHYWSAARYNRFNELAEDGSLAPTDFAEFSDRNFTSFNIDAVYRWRFAPGSDLFFIYKNAVLDFADGELEASYRYWDSLGSLGQFETNNTFNLKLVYYIGTEQFGKG
jgi:hypothetical protein